MPASFSYLSRAADLQRLQQQNFDLLIIGGGINGAGVARDAASRGMRVALVEAQDFASGTSSRSSKLVHGGIRYLENFEFGLVFEALSERARLFDMAPHLVHPLRFVLPVYRGDRVGMTKLGLGMAAYDFLSTYEAPELHERLDAGETMERLPLLNPHGLQGSYVYSDAYMDDDRLVIESLRAAYQDGAVLCSYVRAAEPEWSGDKITGIHCVDEKSGQKFLVRAKHIVGSVGPWTDRYFSQVLPQWQKKLRPTKGIHITVDRKRVNMQQAVVMVSNDQKRIVFGIPRHEMTIFGTTDTDFPGDPAQVRAEPEDIRYVLELVNQYFPGAELSERDILASYAGVRPLVFDGAESEGKTSREHEIWHLPQGISLVAGGKYTTYRKIAEEMTEQVLNFFPLEDKVAFHHSRSKDCLNPKASVTAMEKARSLREWMSRESGFELAWIDKLIDRHGLEALDILARKRSDEVASETLFWVLEARHAIEHGMCGHLVDFYYRRAPLFLSYPDHGHQFLDAICEEFKQQLQWSTEECVAQRKALMQQEAYDLAWR